MNASWPAEGRPGAASGGSSPASSSGCSRRASTRSAGSTPRRCGSTTSSLPYLDARLAATHRHYDRLLTEQGRRLDDVDERHRQLERELVAHVHDLVARIDLVLVEANREKLALAFALEEARARLARLEQALRREG